MSADDRAELERRILALVRDFCDSCDETFEDGWEVGDFVILYEIYEELPDDATLKPWWGGPTRGRGRSTSFSSTTSNWAQDEAMVREALRGIRSRRDEYGSDDDEDPED